jgi:hypothetical protein
MADEKIVITKEELRKLIDEMTNENRKVAISISQEMMALALETFGKHLDTVYQIKTDSPAVNKIADEVIKGIAKEARRIAQLAREGKFSPQF